MIILTIRTDKPDAEIGLLEDTQKLDYQQWYAHRELSVGLLSHIAEMLAAAGKTLQDLEGIAVYKGPGSFTGLRIGVTVANTLAYSLSVPIVATDGEDWVRLACEQLAAGADDRIALPHYGADAHITVQKR